jgi:rubredoxin
MIIAAIRSGTDPVAALPPATVHRTLEDPIYCPKCEASYNLIVDYDQAISRHFPNESRRHLTMLRKAVMMGHSTDHRITHFETNGVTVISHAPAKPSVPLEHLTPASKLIH